MISNPHIHKGTSHVLGRHVDAETCLSTLCPTQRRTGRCPAFQREKSLRHSISAQMEASLRQRAEQLYALSLEEAAAGGGVMSFPTADQRQEQPSRTEVVQRLVEELKAEPAYRHWNLDAELASQMAEKGWKSCSFSHAAGNVKEEVVAATVLRRTLKRNRAITTDGEDAGDDAHLLGNKRCKKEKDTSELQAAWITRRRTLFQGLTGIQKTIVAMLWQLSVTAPRKVIDVGIRDEVEAMYTAAAQKEAPNGEDGDDGTMGLAAIQFDAALEKQVREAEECVCTRMTAIPHLGAFHLSFFPRLLSYYSQAPRNSFIANRTFVYFLGPDHDHQPSAAGSSSREQRLLAGRLSEKELSFDQPAMVDAVLFAIEYLLFVYRAEQMWQCELSEALPAGWTEEQRREYERCRRGGRESEGNDHSSSLPSSSSFQLRALTMQHCNIRHAEAWVNALAKRSLLSSLLSLDLSHNELQSLRFLFQLRAAGEKQATAARQTAASAPLHGMDKGHLSAGGGCGLVRLSLQHNAVVQNPQYRNQVRQCLPRLMLLDGLPIRRPPLRLPYPCTVSTHYESSGTSSSSGISTEERQLVMDFIDRFTYIWETRYIPRTEAELAAAAAGDAKEQQEDEEEMTDENYCHRYHHPKTRFSITLEDGLVLFDPARMRLDREVEMMEAYEEGGSTALPGKAATTQQQQQLPPASLLPLSPQDHREMRMWSVMLYNTNANLLRGRKGLHQGTTTGAANVYLAYLSTLYPERAIVNHHLGSAVTHILRIPIPLDPKAPKRQRFYYLVQLHGVITWQFPSMLQSVHRGSSSVGASSPPPPFVRAIYDRTIVLTPRVITPSPHAALERRRSPRLVLTSDHLHLRAPTSLWPGGCDVVLSAGSLHHQRALTYLFAWGLEGDGRSSSSRRDGLALVHFVMDLARSDAVLHHALNVLVFDLQLRKSQSSSSRAVGRGEWCLLPPTGASTRDSEVDPGDDDDEDSRIEREDHRMACKAVQMVLDTYSQQQQLEEEEGETNSYTPPPFLIRSSLSPLDDEHHRLVHSDRSRNNSTAAPTTSVTTSIPRRLVREVVVALNAVRFGGSATEDTVDVPKRAKKPHRTNKAENAAAGEQRGNGRDGMAARARTKKDKRVSE